MDTIKIQINTDIIIKEIQSNNEMKGWNNFVTQQALPNYSIGHNPCLPFIFQKLFNFKPVHYAIYEGQNLIGVFQAVKKNGIIKSLPVLSTSGLCIKNGYSVDEIYDKLIARFDCPFEIRDFVKCSEFVYDKKATFYLKLQKSKEEQLKFFKSTIRNRILKGIKDGLQVEIGGVELLNKFYEIYLKNMHSKGVPIPSKNYFKTFINDYKNGSSSIFVVYHNNKAIAASIMFTYGKLAEFFWASTLKEFNHLNPNMVLYWEMIKFSIDNKMEIFSYGRSDLDGSNHSFKEKWGTEMIPIFFNYATPQKNIRDYTMVNKVWKKIPLTVARVLGPVIRAKISS